MADSDNVRGLIQVLGSKQDILMIQKAAAIRGMEAGEWMLSALQYTASEVVEKDRASRGNEARQAYKHGLQDGRGEAYGDAIRRLHETSHIGAAQVLEQNWPDGRKSEGVNAEEPRPRDRDTVATPEYQSKGDGGTRFG